MEPLTLTFLGTGNAIPTALRNHSALLLTYKENGFLFDCGEGTQRQFKQQAISLHKITSLFITHWHGDHILGIPGLLQTLAMSDYQKTLHIYGPHGTKQAMHVIRQLIHHINIPHEIHEVTPGTVINTPEYEIQASLAYHDCPALTYSFIIKEKKRLDKAKLKKYKLPNSPLLGQLAAGKDVEYKGKKIKASTVTYQEPARKVSIILDTAYNEKLIAHAQDSTLIVCESSFSKEETEKAKEYCHLTAEQAATIAKKAKADSLILTHISQRYEHKPDKILKEAKRIFKNTRIAKDGDSIVL